MVLEPSIPLAECLEGLITHLSHSGSTKDTAPLFVFSVAFLCHLKRDQAFLHGLTVTGADDKKLQLRDAAFPSAQQIPAISSVLQNPRLFHALLACLRQPRVEGAEFSDGMIQTSGSVAKGRKRSYSFQAADREASKHQKLQRSPMVKTTSHQPATDASSTVVAVPVHVVASTILYASFQHLDHWPAPLVQAYAEDCFGSRSWVDDTRCDLLVQNLALVHATPEDESDKSGNEPSTLEAAQLVAHYYAQRMKIPPSTALLERPRHEGTPSSPLSLSAGRPRSQSTASDPFGFEPVNHADSDSGDNDGWVEISAGTLERAGNGESDASSSSSSGEEDEEVLGTAESFGNADGALGVVDEAGPNRHEADIIFPFTPVSVNLRRVRHRYYGNNLKHARSAIGTALSARLEAKHKQNSRLLVALLSFLSVPEVRCLVAQSLEQWLQSPALSGQARALFTETVQSLERTDPPLPLDIQAIDSLLAMRLKTNQQNIYIEKITKIASRIPTMAVAGQILRRILQAEISMIETAPGTQQSSSLLMVAALHGVLPPNLFAEAFARAIMALLVDEKARETARSSVDEANASRCVHRIRHLMKSVAATLASRFDASTVLDALASFSTPEAWSVCDEEDRARLLFECALRVVPEPADDRSKTQRQVKPEKWNLEDTKGFRARLTNARKILLTWCCATYAPLFTSRKDKFHHSDRKQRLKAEPFGAGPPDFTSVLSGQNYALSPCPDVMRCILFLEETESACLHTFLQLDDPTHDNDQRYRINEWHRYGRGVDNDTIWIVIKSAVNGMSAMLSLSLIECLLHCCHREPSDIRLLGDTSLIWELYRLAEYHPVDRRTTGRSSNEEEAPLASTVDDGSDNEGSNVNCGSLPRLAYPWMWWRVTTIVLIMCGRSPSTIGAEMWKEHPTLRALMKMITSDRYRFPTVDCDEEERDRMKSDESKTRDEEMRLSEHLFLPPLPKPTAKKDEADFGQARQGSRVSARQREKLEKRVRQQRAKEIAEAAKAASRRKKLIHSAQKSIMIWDPRGPARKPPRESVKLILAVNELFGLSNGFRLCIEPDYLLCTVGQATRDAIERASDWIIRVISSLPNLIDRLPPSASCFLLLRAYGQEGDGRSELRKFSSPLLTHVRGSLMGISGATEAIESAELLMADMTDSNPDRRRCARRVLVDTLGKDFEDFESSLEDTTGLQCLLRVKHAESIAPICVAHMAKAISLEDGEVLCDLVLALESFMAFAREREIALSFSFDSVLCSLISNRSDECAEAMDMRQDFLSQALRVVHRKLVETFSKDKDEAMDEIEPPDAVLLVPYALSAGDCIVPLSLLMSACVLLSIWNSNVNSECEEDLQAAIDDLEDTLLASSSSREDGVGQVRKGLASASFLGSGQRAVPVDYWVMLSNARDHRIARRVALSAPTAFLPRLLLCSGLPGSSLAAMIDRLGKLGETLSKDCDETFRQLFSSASISDWAYTGSRRTILRKILGRISAYSNLRYASSALDGDDVSAVFLVWLTKECAAPENQGTKKRSSGVRPLDLFLRAPDLASSTGTMPSSGNMSTNRLTIYSRSESRPFNTITEPEDVKPFVIECIEKGDPESLNAFLDVTCPQSSSGTPVSLSHELSILIVEALLDACQDQSRSVWMCPIVRWVPLLSRESGSPDLWRRLFASALSDLRKDNLLSRCASLWMEKHVDQCQQWLLAAERSPANFDVIRAVEFLVATSGHRSVRLRDLADGKSNSENETWAASRDSLRVAVGLALQSAKLATLPSSATEKNGMPDWLVLLLCIARSGKTHMGFVVESLLEELPPRLENPLLHRRFQVALLRLYTFFPLWMSLGNPTLREILVDGATGYTWREWRSPLDSSIESMTVAVAEGEDHRVLQPLSDIAKNHPLLFLRKLSVVSHVLERDASPDRRNYRSRGRMLCENIAGLVPVEGETLARPVSVTVIHWGYGFTDTLWCSVVDILLNMPKKVLFGCGRHLGLQALLEVYSKLIFIQCQLGSKPSGVRGKYSELLAHFREYDATSWLEWLQSTVNDFPSLGTVRNMLIGCSLVEPSATVDAVLP